LTVLDLGTAATVAAIAALVVGSAAQAVTGFGFSLVAVPVLVLLVGPIHAVQLANEAAVGVNLLLLARDHRTVHLPNALRLLVPALVVAPLTAYVVHRSNLAVLSAVIGAVVVVCALGLASGRRAARLRGRGGMVVAGALSAAMNTASGVGGPAVAMYALNADWPPEMTSPTLQVYFVGLNVVSVLALGPLRLPLGTAAGLVAATALGVVGGTALARRLGAATVVRAVLAMAMVGGGAAIVRGLVGG
jgi:uncharacterized membrane protein YfcA